MRPLAIFIAGTALLAAGCGNGTYPVTGVVRHGGQPLPGGYVRLVPLDHPLEAVSVRVKDGDFQLRATPGVRRVEVLATRRNPTKKDPTGRPLSEEFLPLDYRGERSPLRLDVTASGTNHFELEIPGGPG